MARKTDRTIKPLPFASPREDPLLQRIEESARANNSPFATEAKRLLRVGLRAEGFDLDSGEAKRELLGMRDALYALAGDPIGPPGPDGSPTHALIFHYDRGLFHLPPGEAEGHVQVNHADVPLDVAIPVAVHARKIPEEDGGLRYVTVGLGVPGSSAWVPLARVEYAVRVDLALPLDDLRHLVEVGARDDAHRQRQMRTTNFPADVSTPDVS